MPTDFSDGKTFPRRGREPIGQYLWLARLIDKGRAHAAGTIHDYIYPCPMDKGVLERWGITPAQFDDVLRQYKTDEEIKRWLDQRVSDDAREAANRWLLEEKMENLERQDREEVAPVG